MKRAPDRVLETVPNEAVIKGWLFDGKGNLRHNGITLSIGLYCQHLANIQSRDGDFLFDAEAAEKVTGYNAHEIRAIMRELQDDTQPLILLRSEERGAGGKFMQRRYAIASETPGKALSEFLKKSSTPRTFRQLLYDDKRHYEEIPTYIMDHLRQLKGKPLAVALAGLKEAQAQNAVVFDVNLRHWMEAAGVFEERVMYSAWENTVIKKIMHVDHKKGSHTAHIELFNPTTGKSLKGVWAAAEQRRRAREIDNATLPKKFMEQYAPEELVSWFRWKHPEAVLQGDEWAIDCPQCHGTAHGTQLPHPTLRFNFNIKAGVYSCNAHVSGRKHKSGKNDETFCDYKTSGKMTYHFIMEQEGVTKCEAIREMQDYIEALRAGKPYEEQESLTNSDVQKEEAHDTI